MIVKIPRLVHLRNTILTFNYENSVLYKDMLPWADLPYYFHQELRPWWRYYSEAYGVYYSRVHCNYALCFTNGLKENISVYMPLLMKTPYKGRKSGKLWDMKSFLYKKVLGGYNGWINPKHVVKLEFTGYNYFTSNETSNFSRFPGHWINYANSPEGHRGYGHDSHISAYNGPWNNHKAYGGSFYRLGGLSPSQFQVCVNNYYHMAGFFINLFSSRLTLFSDKYIDYHEIINRKDLLDNSFISQNNTMIGWSFKYTKVYRLLLLFLCSIYFKSFKDRFTYYKILFIKRNKILNIYKIQSFHINKNYSYDKFNLNNMFSSFNKFLFYFSKNYKKKGFREVKGFSWEKGLFYDVLKKKVIKGDKIISFKKNFFFFMTKLMKLRNIETNMLTKGSQQTSKILEVYSMFWGLNFKTYLKNLLSQKNQYKQFSKDYHNGYSNLSHYSWIVKAKKTSLYLRRLTSYGKLFMYTPSKFFKYEFGFKKSNAFMTQRNGFKSRLVYAYEEKLTESIHKFNKNFFFMILALLKLNFGFSDIYRFKRTPVNYKKLKRNFMLKMVYILLEHLSLLKNFLKSYNKSVPYLIEKKINLIKNFFNIFSMNLKKRYFIKAKKFFSMNLRYVDYNYNGVLLGKNKVEKNRYFYGR